VRSTRAPVAATLRIAPDGSPGVMLHDAEEAVSPGQACVFYDAAAGQARVLGGGVIVSTELTGARAPLHLELAS
jgi:tRNA-uridine 2-sulfurtransferase